jgi:hypothetical protein
MYDYHLPVVLERRCLAFKHWMGVEPRPRATCTRTWTKVRTDKEMSKHCVLGVPIELRMSPTIMQHNTGLGASL